MNHPHRSARWQMTQTQLQAAIDALTNGNQSEFARMIGVDGRTVRYWLTGAARVPRPVQMLIQALLLMTPDQRSALN
jgi:DNA-binding transcriptional regulator YiaG